MYVWILEHRDEVFIAIGLSMVILPFVLGALLGHVPTDFLLRAGFPLALLTFSMATGVLFLKRILEPLTMLLVSIVFGLTWAGMGLQLILRKDRNWMGTGKPMPQAVRGIGGLLLGFGLLWIGIAVCNYLGVFSPTS